MSTAFPKTGAWKFTNELFDPFFKHHTVAKKIWRKFEAIRDLFIQRILGYAAAISASWQHPA
jgi:hypothetical protein